jgi:hypothetical protein
MNRMDSQAARALAESLISGSLPRRWSHVQSVAQKAATIAKVFPPHEGAVLVSAAWLHDIGYATPVARSGFHPLDGARYLGTIGAGTRLCALVAHHSGAAFEAELRGLTGELAEFLDERSPVRDALWFCDMTTGPDGQTVVFADRRAEIAERYGVQHIVTRAINSASPFIRRAIDATERLLRQSTCG